MSAKVLDHGRVVPRALTAETTLEGFLSWKSRGQSGQKTGGDSRGMDLMCSLWGGQLQIFELKRNFGKENDAFSVETTSRKRVLG